MNDTPSVPGGASAAQPSETARAQAKQPRSYHHGRTPAAWAGSSIALVGFLTMAVGFLLGPNRPVIYVGAGVVVLALVVTAVMRKLGYGAQ